MILRHRNRKRLSLKVLARDERGVALMLVTLFLPVIVGIFTLAVDMSYLYYTRAQLRVAAEAAALAATAQLPNNNACSDTTSACAIAQYYADLNMPTSKYGNVLAGADVVVGKWTDNCSWNGGVSGLACFEVGPAQGAGASACVNFLFPNAGTANCNAVRVTTSLTAAKSNPLQLRFVSMVVPSYSNFDVGATAIAVYGQGPASAQPTWNVVIAQDITQSLNQTALTKMKEADRTLLDCLNQNAAAGSRMGIALFTGCSGATCNPVQANYQQPVVVTSAGNYTTLSNKIGNPPTTTNNGIMLCGNTNAAGIAMPPCQSGVNNATTDQTSALNASIGMFQGLPPQPAGSRKAIVLVSDGLPQQSGCGDLNSGQANCTALETAAAAAADTAFDTYGIDIYTIFYGSAGVGTANYNAGVSYMNSLRRGNGLSFVTPDATQVATMMGMICATMPHRLVW